MQVWCGTLREYMSYYVTTENTICVIQAGEKALSISGRNVGCSSLPQQRERARTKAEREGEICDDLWFNNLTMV